MAIVTQKTWSDKNKPIAVPIMPEEPGVVFAIKWKLHAAVFDDDDEGLRSCFRLVYSFLTRCFHRDYSN